MANPFVICDNLVKIYKIAELEVVALQGLDLVVNQGEMVGIVGSSGSGKSSLLNILGGLDRPSAGRIWVGGEDLLKLSDSALDDYRSKKIGFVWQQGSRNLISYLTALENVTIMGALQESQDGARKRKHPKELLEMVGLEQRMHHKLIQLSGGEQQRVAIAVALINQPQLLLADEPTGEVDTATAVAIYELFRKLNHDLDLTTMVVSHDPNIARHMDRVVTIRDGKLASEKIRKVAAAQNLFDPTSPEQHDTHSYHELIVLDNAGRLQIPKDYLSRFNINRHVTIDVTDQGILIKPSSEGGEFFTSSEQAVNKLIAQDEERKQGRGILGMMKKITDKFNLPKSK